MRAVVFLFVLALYDIAYLFTDKKRNADIAWIHLVLFFYFLTMDILELSR